MANHVSAEKRNRQRIKRTLRNRAARSALRTLVKQARLAIDGGVVASAKELTHRAEVAIFKAAGKGLLPVNTASRTVSRLQVALNKISA